MRSIVFSHEREEFGLERSGGDLSGEDVHKRGRAPFTREAVTIEHTVAESRRRFLLSVKAGYRKMFETGILSPSALRHLIEANETAYDNGYSLADEWKALLHLTPFLGYITTDAQLMGAKDRTHTPLSDDLGEFVPSGEDCAKQVFSSAGHRMSLPPMSR